MISLNNDMFYHINTTDPTNGQIVRQLWKINETIIRDPNEPYVMPNYKTAHKSSNILHYMATNMYWEIDSQIAAVLLDIDNTYESCFAGNITDKPFCDQITDTRNDPFLEFVCIYSTFTQFPGINTTQPVYGLKIIQYDWMTNEIFYNTSLEFPQLMQMCSNAYYGPLKEAQNSGNLPTNAILLPISGYLRMKYNAFVKNINVNESGVDVIEVEYERTVIIFEKSVTENVIVSSDTSNTSHIFTDLKTIHHIIRLQEVNRLIAIPMKAGINTSVSEGFYEKKPSKYAFRASKLQLKHVFRCLEEALPFDPHVFCSAKQNLGFDSYFQKDGNFWRMNSMGFTRQSNPNLTDDSLINLSFESHFTDLLERDGFDTYQPIHGFTYKPLYSHECSSFDTTCNSFIQGSPFHYRLCIYGFKQSRNEFGVHPHIKSYRYSATDIHPKQEDDMCSAVFKLTVDKDYTVVSAVSNPSSAVNDVSSEKLKNLFPCPHKHTYPVVSNRRKDTRERVVGYTVDYDFATKGETDRKHMKWYFTANSSIAITLGSVSTIILSNQSITVIGASYWKSQSYMYWLTNSVDIQAFYYVSDTKWRFLFPFEHNFDIKYWNERTALRGNYISMLCHTSSASIESQGPTIYTFIFIILALILIIVSIIVAYLAYRFDQQTKQTDNTDKTKAK
ncbi:unnamed protein product [Medioppia subpectinata]|uniref:Uncharacterized protein n=1 Tax=Medioppia subpectinata TaxID=1979941 RepID=A0A7R9KD87_9ACAR|nr:unnamed protein product [Medioppia subpectinata]CAG2101359.1 unnamed protein product [Medioppia subpectinata]